MRPRNNTGAAGLSSPRSYAIEGGIFVLWDLSKAPTRGTNLRERLGRGLKMRGGALIPHEKQEDETTLVDGITNKRGKLAVGPMDPDAFVLRMAGTSQRPLATWMPRLSADSTNDQQSKECRSTMIFDQEDSKSWAWITDAFRLAKPPVGGGVRGEELGFDDAGFLSCLYDKVTSFPNMDRSTLALSVHRNLGFIVDDARIGQLSQILCIGEVQGTVSARTGRSYESSETLLRADTGIYFGAGIGTGRFVHEKGDPKEATDGEDRLVKLFVHTGEVKPDDELNNSEDPKSNISRLEKNITKRPIRGWVKVPRPGG
jgi:hypothetical protein